MTTTFYVFLGLIILVSALLILVIMVQNPKGGGLSSTFGGGTQTVGGVQKTGDFLDKSTWTLAALLIALILLSNIGLKDNNPDSKLLDDNNIENNTLPPANTDSTPIK